MNAIRRAHPALHRFDNLDWLETHNEWLVGYLKRSEDDVVAVVVNIDPFDEREWLVIVPPALGLPERFAVRDELAGDRYPWRTGRNYVKLAPGQAHVMAIEQPGKDDSHAP